MTKSQQAIWQVPISLVCALSLVLHFYPSAFANEPQGLATIRHLDHTILLCNDLQKMRSF